MPRVLSPSPCSTSANVRCLWPVTSCPVSALQHPPHSYTMRQPAWFVHRRFACVRFPPFCAKSSILSQGWPDMHCAAYALQLKPYIAHRISYTRSQTSHIIHRALRTVRRSMAVDVAVCALRIAHRVSGIVQCAQHDARGVCHAPRIVHRGSLHHAPRVLARLLGATACAGCSRTSSVAHRSLRG